MDEPDFYRTTTSIEPTEEVSSGGGGGEWIWLILFIIAILVIIGLVIWLIYSYRRNTKGNLLQLNNVIMEPSSNTQITATWTDTGNSSDKVTLYATLDPPEYNNDGTLSNPGAQSISTSGEAGSVTLNGLQKGLKYYSTLILTNSNTNNYQVFNQIIFMQTKDIPTTVLTSAVEPTGNTFSIDDIIQVGKIEMLAPAGSTGPYSVQFNQIPIDQNSLWFYNGNSQIQLARNDLDPENICLFNSNGSLVAKDCSGGNTDSQWTYNPTKNANKWCLTSTLSNTNPTCMNLGTITTKGTAPITVNNTSTAGDAWALAFQHLN